MPPESPRLAPPLQNSFRGRCYSNVCKKLSQISTASNRQKHLGAHGSTYPLGRSWLSAVLVPIPWCTHWTTLPTLRHGCYHWQADWPPGQDPWLPPGALAEAWCYWNFYSTLHDLCLPLLSCHQCLINHLPIQTSQCTSLNLPPPETCHHELFLCIKIHWWPWPPGSIWWKICPIHSSSHQDAEIHWPPDPLIDPWPTNVHRPTLCRSGSNLGRNWWLSVRLYGRCLS